MEVQSLMLEAAARSRGLNELVDRLRVSQFCEVWRGDLTTNLQCDGDFQAWAGEKLALLPEKLEIIGLMDAYKKMRVRSLNVA